MTDEERKTQFKYECEKYLSSISLAYLRAYGRSLQLSDPTRKKKSELIKEIIMALCGEISTARSNKGAPIKNDYVPQNILEEIAILKRKYLSNPLEIGETLEVIENVGVSLQFVVKPSFLNKKQKRLLNDFLNSL